MSFRRLTAEWWNDEAPREIELRVSAADDGYFEGYLNFDSQGQLRLTTGGFEVAEKLRGKGLGTRIMMGTLALAKSHGATYTSAHITSPAALRIRQKIFGEEIEITDIFLGSPVLPITTEQAIQSLQIGEEFERRNPDHDKELGLTVGSSLVNLNTEGWELPIEKNSPLISELI